MYNEGCSGFQVTGVIKWGQKSKPNKIPRPKINLQKKNPMAKLQALNISRKLK